MSARVRRLAVLGLGLLGGSVALAARRRGLAERVVGSGRRRTALAAACAQGVVDEVAEPVEAVREADLVVLATPVSAMPRILAAAAPGLSGDCLVTDVGSVKTALSETLPGLLPPGACYLGSHPMAGSHLRGVEHASADLFEGAPCAVTPTPETPEAAIERLSAFWRAIGARVVLRDPATHDAEVAWISHVPHALAFAFARALESAPERAGEVAGAGFRDFTRIARSEAELWSEILTANRKAVAGPLQRAAHALASLCAAVEANDAEAVERFVAQAHEMLARVAGAEGPAPRGPREGAPARSGGRNPEIPTAANGGPHRS